MDRPNAVSLIRRLIARVESDSTDEADGVLTESAEEFLCPARFARERRQFFFDTPQVIGFAGEVKRPNSYLTAEVMGVPLLVTRDRDGVLHASINACAHRGAQVAHGNGQRARLTCRFHGWTYALDGTLAGRPRDRCFAADRSPLALKSLPVSDRSGLIVVGIDPDMPQSVVDAHLAEIEPQFSGFAFGEMHSLETRRFEVNANWKLVAALSYESYHFATLHRDSVALALEDNAIADFFGRHSRWAFPLKGIDQLRGMDESQWPGAVPGAVSHVLFPGTVVITNPEDAQILRTEPGASVGQSVVYYTGVFRQEEHVDAARAAYDFGGKAFLTEDLPAAVECQKGLAASRQRIRIGTNEPVVQFWHRKWREMLAD